MNDEYKKMLIGWVVTSLIILVVVSGAITIYPQVRREHSLRARSEELRQQIEAKKIEVAKLKENQQRFRSDSDFVEMIARQNHRVFPGELVFLFEGKE